MLLNLLNLNILPTHALDGHVVVLFNGAGDISYAAYDLRGKTTDANGLFIIANTALVIGSDIDMGASNKLQNGAGCSARYSLDLRLTSQMELL